LTEGGITISYFIFSFISIFFKVERQILKEEIMSRKNEARKQAGRKAAQHKTPEERSAASRKAVETQRRHEMERKGQT
jgi:hypothetical protein